MHTSCLILQFTQRNNFVIRCSVLEKDVTRCKENHKESEILLGALNALQDKTAHLEDSLSAETRIKLDLFSALGEARRQLEIKDSKYNFILIFVTIVQSVHLKITE